MPVRLRWETMHVPIPAKEGESKIGFIPLNFLSQGNPELFDALLREEFEEGLKRDQKTVIGR